MASLTQHGVSFRRRDLILGLLLNLVTCVGAQRESEKMAPDLIFLEPETII